MKSGCSASSVLICQYQPEKGIVKAGSPRLAGAVGVLAPSAVVEATRLVR